jgi:hypothetical protein
MSRATMSTFCQSEAGDTELMRYMRRLRLKQIAVRTMYGEKGEIERLTFSSAPLYRHTQANESS